MQWEIAAASAVVWHVDLDGMCARWANETSTEPEQRCSLPWSGTEVGFVGRHQRLDLFRIPFLGLAEGPYCVCSYNIATGSPGAGVSWSGAPRLTAAVEGFSGLSGTAIASHLHAIATANGS